MTSLETIAVIYAASAIFASGVAYTTVYEDVCKRPSLIPAAVLFVLLFGALWPLGFMIGPLMLVIGSILRLFRRT